jgi:hypothetical protein
MGLFSKVLNDMRVVGESDLSLLGTVELNLATAGQWYEMDGTFEDNENKNFSLNAANGELTFTGSRNAVNTSSAIFRLQADKVCKVSVGTFINDNLVGFNDIDLSTGKEDSLTNGNISESSPNVTIGTRFKSDTANTTITFKIFKVLINGFLEPV